MTNYTAYGTPLVGMTWYKDVPRVYFNFQPSATTQEKRQFLTKLIESAANEIRELDREREREFRNVSWEIENESPR